MPIARSWNRNVNAVAESFFSSLKNGSAYRLVLQDSLDQALLQRSQS
ncbi:hypothetical protein BJM06_a00191 (plasmid) [Enterobacter cloacae]|nr:hypothetical protein BJM06_a00191 [Enterobacter cloacae]